MLLTFSMNGDLYLNIENKDTDWKSCPARENCIGTYIYQGKPLAMVAKSPEMCWRFMGQGEKKQDFFRIAYIKAIGPGDYEGEE